MLDNIAIRVKNLSKVYQKRDFKGNKEDFYALKDVTFEVKKGEVIGVVGKNGSGKSTLLKILSGITKPTSGSIEISGSIASILDVGTGFHPDLSGRDNIFLRGELLGMTRTEIHAVFDEIVAFSEIGDFIETPVKNYSSGMFLRLAFSILVFLKCDILLLDEVMAVGDSSFQKKCFSKINELSISDKTIIIVSHEMQLIANLTSKIIFLKKGTILYNKQSALVLNEIQEEKMAKIRQQEKINFEKSINKEKKINTILPNQKKEQNQNFDNLFCIISAELFDENKNKTRKFDKNSSFTFILKFETFEDDVDIGFLIRDQFDKSLAGYGTADQYSKTTKGTYIIRYKEKASFFLPGYISFSIVVYKGNNKIYFKNQALIIQILESDLKPKINYFLPIRIKQSNIEIKKA